MNKPVTSDRNLTDFGGLNQLDSTVKPWNDEDVRSAYSTFAKVMADRQAREPSARRSNDEQNSNYK